MVRRILILASDPAREQLGRLLASQSRPAWFIVEANSLEQARFLQQLNPCDVLLVDGSCIGVGGHGAGNADELRCLARSPRVPLVLLADDDAQSIARCLDQGASHWLPRQLALAQPAVLASVLRQASRHGNLRRRLRQCRCALSTCRQLVQRLLALLWQAASTDVQTPWLTQRQILERLDEEVERSRRHGTPLSVVLAEMRPAAGSKLPGYPGELFQRIARLVQQNKRRGDVAGQHGGTGFMLLLPHTASPGAADCCRRLRPMLEGHPPPAAALPQVQFWFGIASFAEAKSSPKSLLSTAEQKLDAARRTPEERLAH